MEQYRLDVDPRHVNVMGKALPWNGRYSEGPTHKLSPKQSFLSQTACLETEVITKAR